MSSTRPCTGRLTLPALPSLTCTDIVKLNLRETKALYSRISEINDVGLGLRAPNSGRFIVLDFMSTSARGYI